MSKHDGRDSDSSVLLSQSPVAERYLLNGRRVERGAAADSESEDRMKRRDFAIAEADQDVVPTQADEPDMREFAP